MPPRALRASTASVSRLPLSLPCWSVSLATWQTCSARAVSAGSTGRRRVSALQGDGVKAGDRDRGRLGGDANLGWLAGRVDGVDRQLDREVAQVGLDAAVAAGERPVQGALEGELLVLGGEPGHGEGAGERQLGAAASDGDGAGRGRRRPSSSPRPAGLPGRPPGTGCASSRVSSSRRERTPLCEQRHGATGRYAPWRGRIVPERSRRTATPAGETPSTRTSTATWAFVWSSATRCGRSVPFAILCGSA